jgi:hypothetical protein
MKAGFDGKWTIQIWDAIGVEKELKSWKPAWATAGYWNGLLEVKVFTLLKNYLFLQYSN